MRQLNRMLCAYRDKLEAVELIENSHPEKYKERKTELQILIRLVIEEMKRVEIKPKVRKKNEHYAKNREKLKEKARANYHANKEKRRKDKLLNALWTIQEK